MVLGLVAIRSYPQCNNITLAVLAPCRLAENYFDSSYNMELLQNITGNVSERFIK